VGGKKQKQVRGESLVDRVVDAALEELSARGYEGFCVEAVAERAGVNKTTIYRRWPTRVDLARAALARSADTFALPSDTGTVRGDLVSFMKSLRDFASSTQGRSLMRMLLADDREVADLAQSMREAKESIPREIVDRAVARGEIPRGTDATLVFDTIVAAVQHQVLFLRGPCDDRWIAQLVDLVVVGAEHSTNRPVRSLAKPKAKASTVRRSTRSQ
jgi:AcrR family transcriptional regulator